MFTNGECVECRNVIFFITCSPKRGQVWAINYSRAIRALNGKIKIKCNRCSANISMTVKKLYKVSLGCPSLDL